MSGRVGNQWRELGRGASDLASSLPTQIPLLKPPRMSICMPSENPDLDGMMASEIQGMSPQAEEEQQESSGTATLADINADELPPLLNEAIGKFCELGEAKHLTKRAAEVAEFVKFHSEYPLLSSKQIQLGKASGGEADEGEGEKIGAKRHHKPNLLEKQQVRRRGGEGGGCGECPGGP